MTSLHAIHPRDQLEVDALWQEAQDLSRLINEYNIHMQTLLRRLHTLTGHPLVANMVHTTDVASAALRGQIQ
jgi:hypothetical protein